MTADLQGDPQGDAQNLGSLLGKILRLDVGVAVSDPADTTAPALRARASSRQRVLRLRGAVAYVRCTESCSVAAEGRLRIAGACLSHAKGRNERRPGAARTR